MEDKQLLSFIKNEDLYKHVETVLNTARAASTAAENNLYSNVIDPFSALFDASSQGLYFDQWIQQEKSRQVQKTLQNAIGDFHQNILGSIDGCVNLQTGAISDFCNNNKKIIAEIKNKYNTTKGNHKIAIYDDFKNMLKSAYVGYVAYYVEVIPQGHKIYDKPFTPSDNKTKTRRPTNKNIRIIDGRSFYALISGEADALERLYLVLPKVIGDIFGDNEHVSEIADGFKELFYKAY